MASVVDYMLIKKATLQGIGSAIRERKGTTNLIPVENMAAEIKDIKGTSLVSGGCKVLVGGTFSFNYGGLENVSVYHPSCVTYTNDGEYIIFTAVSAGNGTVTVASGSTTLLVYNVTVQANGATCSHPTFTTKVTTPATCAVVGKKTHTCSICSATWTEDIPKLNHTWSDPYYSTTDFESGYGMKCTVCGALSEGDCPHTNKSSKVTEPTCSSTGVRTYVCTACGKTLGTETIPTTAHYLLNDWFVTKEATCIAEGTQRRYCHNDNCSYYEEQSIDKTAHVWGENPVEYGDGYAYVCTICGAYDPIPDTNCPHAAEVIDVVYPNCTSGGYTTYKCSLCGYEWNDDYTEKLGHNYKSVVTAPTCESVGYTTHTCSRCPDSYVDSYTVATGHTEGEHVPSNTPSCIENVTYEVHCAICNGVMYEYSDDGHFGDHVLTGTGWEEEATCTEPSTWWNICDVCHSTVFVGNGDNPALGHDPGEQYDENGETWYVCKRCGEKIPV